MKRRGPNSFWAFPIVGLMLGSLVFLLIYVAAGYFPTPILAVFALIGSVMVTGALHEDGLADCADGFWGGHGPKRRLNIMKDSAIGVYGTSALILSFALRAICMVEIINAGATLWIIPLYAISRSWMVGLMWYMPNAREDGMAVHVGKPPIQAVATAILITLTVAIGFGMTALIASAATVIGAYFVYTTAMQKIKGYTGDVLGAAQIISEITGLLVIVALL